jgi:hypothetical protein
LWHHNLFLSHLQGAAAGSHRLVAYFEPWFDYIDVASEKVKIFRKSDDGVMCEEMSLEKECFGSARV